MQVHSNN